MGEAFSSMSSTSGGGSDNTTGEVGGDITGADAELTTAGVIIAAAAIGGFFTFGVRGWRGFFGAALAAAFTD